VTIYYITGGGGTAALSDDTNLILFNLSTISLYRFLLYKYDKVEPKHNGIPILRPTIVFVGVAE
jgi:hypothetical protein